MTQYNCRIYKNTGFNAVNIPDSYQLLEDMVNTEEIVCFDTETLTIMQNRFLDSVAVKATWENVANADYLRIYADDTAGWFYFVDGVSMQAEDVAVLSLTPDYITSTGRNVSQLEFLDGVTSRAHVATDTFGEYCEADPLTAPAQPMQLNTLWFRPSGTAHTYVESTLNLPITGARTVSVKYASSNDDAVEVPTVCYLGGDYDTGATETSYTMAGTAETSNPKTMLYDLDDSEAETLGEASNKEVRRGIARARDIGVEQGGIISQVQIPLAYAETTASQTNLVTVVNIGSSNITVTNKKISAFGGKTGTVSSGLSFTFASGAKNNRVNYGEFTKYGIVSCAGDSVEYSAEDLIDGNETSPILKFVADPRPDGKPYFRYRTVNGDSTDIGFFRNCISGLNWKQIPLVFTAVSGNALNTLKYQNSRMISDYEYNYSLNNMVNTVAEGLTGDIKNLLGNLANTAGSTEQSRANFTQSANQIANYAGDLANFFWTPTKAKTKYEMAKHNEMQDYLVQNYVASPTINFPYNSEALRDFYGNGCLMYRYVYTQSDISRIDKLLTMYGYKVTKPLEASDFNNRQYFNYVECANVSVTGFSNWRNNGIAEMLKNGVRIWHVKPDKAHYANNPIVS